MKRRQRLKTVLILITACITAASCALFAQTSSVLVDPNLAQAVRGALNKPEGDLSAADLLSLTNLSAINTGIQSLVGLEAALHLQSLDLAANGITNIAPLANLQELVDLNLFFNPVQDHAPLASLTRLRKLNLTGNRLKQIGALASLTSLTNLVLVYNHVSDCSPLLQLTDLVALDLRHNLVTDLAPLKALRNLRDLGLGDMGLSNAVSFVEFTNLYRLDLSNNRISNPVPLLNLAALRQLDLTGNPLSQPAMLAQFTNLTSLAVGNDGITNLLPLSGLTQLLSLSVGNNGCSDLFPLNDLTNLVYLDVSGNRITNVFQLARLTKIEELWAESCALWNLDFLQNLPGLKVLEVSFNQLSELKQLIGLTNLTRVAGAMNLLTNLNGLEGLPKLSFVVVTGNLLDFRTDSEAANIIQTLTNRGATVYFEPQARVPTIFIRTNWLVVAGQRTSIPFFLDADGTPEAPPVCAAISLNPGVVPQTNLAVLSYYDWNLSLIPLQDQTGPVTVTLSATNYAGLGTNVTILVEVVPPITFDGRQLDSQGLVWTTAGSPPWFNQTVVTHDGDGAAQSGATNSLLQTRVTGPGLLSFWWLFESDPLGYYGQFVATSPEGTNVAFEILYPAGGWCQGRFRLPRGEWILQWRPFDSYWFSYGSSNSLWLDDVSFVPGETPCNLRLAQVGEHSDDGSFWVNLEGALNQGYDIEVSNDLRQWTPLTRVTCYGFHGQFSDWNSGAVARFYRAKPVPPIDTQRSARSKSLATPTMRSPSA
jgi:internalin A